MTDAGTYLLDGCHNYLAYLMGEPLIPGGFYKKVFLKIWQNLLENTCARVSFLINLQVSGLQLYWKKTLAQVLCYEFKKKFEEHLFYKTLPVAASGDNNWPQKQYGSILYEIETK